MFTASQCDGDSSNTIGLLDGTTCVLRMTDKCSCYLGLSRVSRALIRFIMILLSRDFMRSRSPEALQVADQAPRTISMAMIFSISTRTRRGERPFWDLHHHRQL